MGFVTYLDQQLVSYWLIVVLTTNVKTEVVEDLFVYVGVWLCIIITRVAEDIATSVQLSLDPEQTGLLFGWELWVKM